MHVSARGFFLVLIASDLALFACKTSSEQNPVRGDVKQIADMSPSFISANWSCKMLAYDFDKYYPRLLGIVDKMDQSHCLGVQAPKSVFSQMGEASPVAVDIFKIEDERIVDVKALPLVKKECASDYDFALDTMAYVTLLQANWTAKSCSRAAAAASDAMILDSPACLSPCDSTLASCTICTPVQNTQSSLKVDAPGTITCGSEADARIAVQDFCATNALASCAAKCATLRNGDEIVKPFREIAGTVGTSTDAVTVAVNGEFESSLGGTLTIPGIPDTNIGARTSVKGSYNASTTVQINSNLPYIWVKNLASPAKVRHEAAAGVTYSCSINSIKLNSLEGRQDAAAGIDILGFKIKVGGSTSMKGQNTVTSAFSRSNANAAGKSRDDIIEECKKWTKDLIANTAFASFSDSKLDVYAASGLKCSYKNYPGKSYVIRYLYITSGRAHKIQYLADGAIFSSKSPEYEVAASVAEKYLIATVEGTRKVIARGLLETLFNDVLVPASADTEKWALTQCTLVGGGISPEDKTSQ